MTALYNKYRPVEMDHVLGQYAVTESLDNILANRSSQTFLFSGPSGVGKTTIARIVAHNMGCQDRIDIDGATYTGIDKIREIQEILDYRPFGQSRVRAIIIDEAHRLSPNAWDALLGTTEEPPKHIIWLFCTTNPGKIPATIRSRCTHFELQLIPDDELSYLVNDVVKAENMDIPEQVLGVIIKAARGSARQVLVNLDKCRNVKDREQAAELLNTMLEDDVTMELCRFVIKGGSWKRAVSLVKQLNGASPEGFRIIMCNYLAKVLENETGDPTHLLNKLEQFSVPFNDAEKNAPLLLAIGRCLYAQG